MKSNRKLKENQDNKEERKIKFRKENLKNWIKLKMNHRCKFVQLRVDTLTGIKSYRKHELLQANKNKPSPGIIKRNRRKTKQRSKSSNQSTMKIRKLQKELRKVYPWTKKDLVCLLKDKKTSVSP